MISERVGVVPVNIEEEMKSCYIDYAMSVIIGRAIPDARDGLKPVHRRTLYAMWEMGNTSDKPYKIAVGDGLYLEIKPNGSKLWRWKYRLLGKEMRPSRQRSTHRTLPGWL